MDYEKKIRDYINSNNVDPLYKSVLIIMFPELVDSDDEKIRNALIDFFNEKNVTDYFMGIPPKRIVAWLERQKKVEWSQDDLICLGYLADFVDNTGDDYYGKNKPNVVKWIRSFAELPTHIPFNED